MSKIIGNLILLDILTGGLTIDYDTNFLETWNVLGMFEIENDENLDNTL